MIELTSDQRRQLRARAHALHPVASLGQQGLTEAVLKEIGCALDAHGLIKVKLHGSEREERAVLCAQICQRLGCALVQHIGSMLVLWRERREGTEASIGQGRRSARLAATTMRQARRTRRAARTPSRRG